MASTVLSAFAFNVYTRLKGNRSACFAASFTARPGDRAKAGYHGRGAEGPDRAGPASLRGQARGRGRRDADRVAAAAGGVGGPPRSGPPDSRDGSDDGPRGGGTGGARSGGGGGAPDRGVRPGPGRRGGGRGGDARPE